MANNHRFKSFDSLPPKTCQNCGFKMKQHLAVCPLCDHCQNCGTCLKDEVESKKIKIKIVSKDVLCV